MTAQATKPLLRHTLRPPTPAGASRTDAQDSTGPTGTERHVPHRQREAITCHHCCNSHRHQFLHKCWSHGDLQPNHRRHSSCIRYTSQKCYQHGGKVHNFSGTRTQCCGGVGVPPPHAGHPLSPIAQADCHRCSSEHFTSAHVGLQLHRGVGELFSPKQTYASLRHPKTRQWSHMRHRHKRYGGAGWAT